MSCDYYPPGCVTYTPPQYLEQRCCNGHSWEARMFWELGGWFYSDEDNGPYCPECGEEAR